MQEMERLPLTHCICGPGIVCWDCQGEQEGVDANRTSVFRADPTKLELEEEELPVQLPSNPRVSKG